METEYVCLQVVHHSWKHIGNPLFLSFSCNVYERLPAVQMYVLQPEGEYFVDPSCSGIQEHEEAEVPQSFFIICVRSIEYRTYHLFGKASYLLFRDRKSVYPFGGLIKMCI